MGPAISAAVVLITGFVTPGISMAAAFAMAGVTLALGVVSYALAPRPKTESLSQQASRQTLMFRASDAPRTIIYGKAMVSGPLVHAGRNDNTNEYLHFIVPLTGHEVNAIGDVYFNDTISTDNRFAGYFRIKKHLGTPVQAADSDAVAELSEWTSAHRLKGIAYLYIRLKFNPDVWASGFPNVKAIVDGRKVWDPRAATKTITSSTPNGATTTMDITGHGYSAGDSIFITGHSGAVPILDGEYYINSITDADTLEILVTLSTGGTGGTSSKMTYSNNAALCQLDYLHNRQGIGAPSARIDTASWIAAANICDEDVALDADSIVTYQDRYECDGVVYRTEDPMPIMDKLLSASAGSLINKQGKYYGYAGAYTAPTAETITESNLRGNISTVAKPGRAARFNAVRGSFIDSADYYQLTDFPPATNSAYEVEDGNERIYYDMELPFTTNIIRAQRIAKTHLERHRQGGICNYPGKMSLFEIVGGEVIQVSYLPFTWADKTFRVLNLSFPPEGGIDLVLQEETSAVYDWAYTDATILGDPGTATPPDIYSVAPLTNLVLASGTNELLLMGDGSVVTRIKASWTAHTDKLVTDGGRIELQFKKSADSTWMDAPPVLGSESMAWVTNIQDGINYDVRVRAVNANGVHSAWTTEAGHNVTGKTLPPGDVTNFSATMPSAGDVTMQFSWTGVGDADLAAYEIRYNPIDDSTWATATKLVAVPKGQSSVTIPMPIGDWTVLIKALDTSFNYSTNAAETDVSVTLNSLLAWKHYAVFSGGDSGDSSGDSSGAPEYSYREAVSGLDYTVVSGDRLEYDIMFEPDSADQVGGFDLWNDESVQEALSETSGVDQNGVSVHPSADLNAYANGKWYHRIIELTDSLVGWTGANINDAATAIDDALNGTVKMWIRNPKITDSNGDVQIYLSKYGFSDQSVWAHIGEIGVTGVVVDIQAYGQIATGGIVSLAVTRGARGYNSTTGSHQSTSEAVMYTFSNMGFRATQLDSLRLWLRGELEIYSVTGTYDVTVTGRVRRTNISGTVVFQNTFTLEAGKAFPETFWHWISDFELDASSTILGQQTYVLTLQNSHGITEMWTRYRKTKLMSLVRSV